MYRVLEYFEDLQDKNHIYRAGDYFPRPGFKPSAERLDELASNDNKRGRPLIVEEAAKQADTGTAEAKVEEAPAPKETARKRGRKPKE